MKCPFCGANNIEGTDFCESCFESLVELGHPKNKESFHQRSVLEDPLSRLAHTATVFVEPTQTVLEASQKMNAGNVGCALVVCGKLLEGILTERHILYKVLAEKKKTDSVKVREVMRQNPEVLREEDPIAYALHKMAIYGIRHIPVLRKKRELGVISVRDILQYLAKALP